MRAIIELKSEQTEAMYSFPGGLRMGDGLTTVMSPLCFQWEKSNGGTCSWTLPNIALALPLV